MFLHSPFPRDRRDIGRSGESGQALIETAISLTILILILIGSVEIGRIAWASIQVTNAAKAAVQYGDIDTLNSQDTTGMQNAAANEAPAIPNLGPNTNITTTCICSDMSACLIASSTVRDRCPGSSEVDTLNVTATDNFDPLIHLPGMPTTFTIDGTAVQQVLSSGF